MQGATQEELRELSSRSRRAHAWGAAAAAGSLALVPILAAAWSWWPGARVAWAVGATAAGGLLLVRYAFVAGAERGAFRRVWRRIREDARSRTLVPEAPAPALREPTAPPR